MSCDSKGSPYYNVSAECAVAVAKALSSWTPRKKWYRCHFVRQCEDRFGVLVNTQPIYTFPERVVLIPRGVDKGKRSDLFVCPFFCKVKSCV